MTTAPREITAPVELVRPDGRLNPDAVGWSRRPLHDTSGVKRGLRGLGRNKRWEYWLVTTPEVLVSLTLSDIDYAGVHTVWAYERATGRRVDESAVVPFAWHTDLPGSLGAGVAEAGSRGLAGRIEETAGGTRLRARAEGVRLVPGESWAILDHGRGRWPYSMWWNWAAGAGHTADGRALGLQFGGKWTDGTGQLENAVVVDGTLFPLHDSARGTAPSPPGESSWRSTACWASRRTSATAGEEGVASAVRRHVPLKYPGGYGIDEDADGTGEHTWHARSSSARGSRGTRRRCTCGACSARSTRSSS